MEATAILLEKRIAVLYIFVFLILSILSNQILMGSLHNTTTVVQSIIEVQPAESMGNETGVIGGVGSIVGGAVLDLKPFKHLFKK